MSTNNSSNSKRKSIFATAIANPSLTTGGASEASLKAIELEKLQQEITLTLQQIDQSFSKSHKIINEDIIPVVNRYHLNSQKIWNGVTFWKNFLENAAQVNLKVYDDTSMGAGFSGASFQTDDSNTTIVPGDRSKPSGQDSNEILTPVKLNKQKLIDPTNFNPIMPNLKNTSTTDQDNNKGGGVRNELLTEFDTTDSILPVLPVFQEQDSTYEQLLRSGPQGNYKIQMTPKSDSTNKRSIGVVNSVTPNRNSKKVKTRKSSIAERFDSSSSDIETPKLNSDISFDQKETLSGSPKQRTPKPHPKEGKGQETQRFPKDSTPKVFQKYNITDDSLSIHDPPQLAQLDPYTSKELQYADSAGRTVKRSPVRKLASEIISKVLEDVSGVNDSIDDDPFIDRQSFTTDIAKTLTVDTNAEKGNNEQTASLEEEE